MYIYNFTNGVIVNFQMFFFCYVALLIGQKTSQNTHTHTHTKKKIFQVRDGAFKHSNVGLKASFISVQYCLCVCVYLSRISTTLQLFYIKPPDDSGICEWLSCAWWPVVIVNRFKLKYLPQGNVLKLRNAATVQTCQHFITWAARRRTETLLQSYISMGVGPAGPEKLKLTPRQRGE